MLKNVCLLLILSHLFFVTFGVQSKSSIFSNTIVDLSPNISKREEWLIKGKEENYRYISEIQVHLGKGNDKELQENSKSVNNGTTPHFTVLTNGEVIQHAHLDQIAHSLPKQDQKQILQDQYLIHINLAGREPNLKQIEATHQLINDIRKIIPNITIKWCALESYLLTIPWIKDPDVFQYSDSLDFYKFFILTHHSSEINTIADRPVYWIPSINFYPRSGSSPEVLNIFRTGTSVEETCISYLNKNKKMSSHFTIDENGRIFQHLSLDKASFFVSPVFGSSEVGKDLSVKQITIGLSGLLKYPISLNQKESLLDLYKFLIQKYRIKNWTTPVPSTKGIPVLEQNLLPDLKILNEVYLSKDSQMMKTKSLIYDYPSPNQSKRPENTVIDTIVLHHTFSSWHGALMNFSTKDNVSAHFTINQDGTVVQHVPLEMKAWHAGVSKDKREKQNVNEFSIGIELVNTGDYKDSYTEEQISALKNLLNDLKDILGKNLYQITTHEYVGQPKGRKIDPLGFPWEKLKEFEEYIVRNSDEDILKILIGNMQIIN